jgi:hypothetical protein
MRGRGKGRGSTLWLGNKSVQNYHQKRKERVNKISKSKAVFISSNSR